MKIKDSTEWNKVRDTLIHQSGKFYYKHDIYRMLVNIGDDIRQLSREEVEARCRRSNRADEMLNKINQNIELVEEYILVAALLG